MATLKFRDDKEASEHLADIQKEIDDYVDHHPDEFNEEEHAEFKELLSKRADALSEATGMKIHSLFD